MARRQSTTVTAQSQTLSKFCSHAWIIASASSSSYDQPLELGS